MGLVARAPREASVIGAVTKRSPAARRAPVPSPPPDDWRQPDPRTRPFEAAAVPTARSTVARLFITIHHLGALLVGALVVYGRKRRNFRGFLARLMGPGFRLTLRRDLRD